MNQTLLPALPGYKPEVRKLTQRQRSQYGCRVRQFASDAEWWRLTHESSRRYFTGMVMKGRVAFFADWEERVLKLQGPSQAKAFGCEGEAEAPWACQIGQIRNENGRYGLTRKAGRWIEHQAWTLEGWKERLAFWTITLPSSALLQLRDIDDGWGRFQRRVYQELGRLLKKKGAPVLYVGVTELQPGRSAKEAMPCPHLHVLFLGKPSGKRSVWHLTPEELDGVIESACVSAGLTLPEGKEARRAFFRAAGNVKRVKRDAGKYLAKYMSKGGDSVAGWNDPALARGLFVRQWWASSKDLKMRARARMPVIHGDFAAWALCKESLLRALELVNVKEFLPQGERLGGVQISAIRRDGFEWAYRLWTEQELPGWEGEKLFLPEKVKYADEMYVREYDSSLQLVRSPAIRATSNKVPISVGLIPRRHSQPDVPLALDGDGFHRALTDRFKERLEFIYREVDVPEPVFGATAVLREERQTELPLAIDSAGSSWDVAPPDSFDPFWDSPSWRGGPGG